MPFLRVGVSPKAGLFAILLGLLGAAAFPPFGVWPLILVSIALFLRLIRDGGARDARNLGLLYGLAFGAGTMYWFFGIFSFLAISLIGLMAAYFGLLAWLISMTRGRSPFVRAALAALFAVAVEWLRGDAWYLRFPWYAPPHALAAWPAMIALSGCLGGYGLSGVIWFIAAAGAFRKPVYWGVFLILPAASLLLPAIGAPDRRALLIQLENLSVDSLIGKLPDEKVDIVVLPEYAYFTSPEAVLKQRQGPATLAKKYHCPVVFGAVEGTYGDPNFDNVAAICDAEGKLIGVFPKQHPLPLFMDGRPGTRRPVFLTTQGVLGVAICYDFDAPMIASSLAHQGATVFVCPSYDAMSWGRIQHENHELLLRLRAVENKRWILRAASSGRTEAIDPHGVPSQEGVVIGKTGFVVTSYGHCHRWTLGGLMAYAGPVAAGLTGIYLLFRLWSVIAQRKRATVTGRPESGLQSKQND